MTNRLKRGLAGAATLALASGMMVAMPTAAHASSAAAGSVVFSGCSVNTPVTAALHGTGGTGTYTFSAGGIAGGGCGPLGVFGGTCVGAGAIATASVDTAVPSVTAAAGDCEVDPGVVEI